MRFGSTITFGAAFLCALIAALLVRAMLVGGEGTGSAGADMESIVVAARDLKAGDKLIPSAIREVRWPADLLPKGAFTSRKDLFKEAGERTLSAAIAENEPILAHRLLNGDNGLAGRLHDGMRGLTIRVNEASGVGGFVQPDDHVDVLLTQTDKAGEANSQARAYTKTLVRNVKVLATDQQTERRQQTQPPKTVTLEVTDEDAKKLTLAGAIGQLSLTLNKGDRSAESGRTVNLRDIAGLPEASREQPTEDGSVVGVFRFGDRKVYRVQQE